MLYIYLYVLGNEFMQRMALNSITFEAYLKTRYCEWLIL